MVHLPRWVRGFVLSNPIRVDWPLTNQPPRTLMNVWTGPIPLPLPNQDGPQAAVLLCCIQALTVALNGTYHRSSVTRNGPRRWTCRDHDSCCVLTRQPQIQIQSWHDLQPTDRMAGSAHAPPACLPPTAAPPTPRASTARGTPPPSPAAPTPPPCGRGGRSRP